MTNGAELYINKKVIKDFSENGEDGFNKHEIERMNILIKKWEDKKENPELIKKFREKYNSLNKKLEDGVNSSSQETLEALNAQETQLTSSDLVKGGISRSVALDLAKEVLKIKDPLDFDYFKEKIESYQVDNNILQTGKINKETYNGMLKRVPTGNTDEEVITETSSDNKEVAGAVITDTVTTEKENKKIDSKDIHYELENHNTFLKSLLDDTLIDENDIKSLLSIERELKNTILKAQDVQFENDEKTHEFLEELSTLISKIQEKYNERVKIKAPDIDNKEKTKINSFFREITTALTISCTEKSERAAKKWEKMSIADLAKQLDLEDLTETGRGKIISILTEKFRKEKYIIKYIPKEGEFGSFSEKGESLNLGIDNQTLTTLALILSKTDDDIENDAYAELPFNSMLYSLIDKFDFKNEKGEKWDASDFEADPEGIITGEKDNLKLFKKQISEKITELTAENQKQEVPEHKKQENRIWLQKLELLKTRITNPEAISKKALNKAINIDRTVKELTSLAGVKGKQKRDLMKDLMNGDISTAMENNALMPIAIIVVLFAFLFSDKVPKWLKTSAWGYIGAWAVTKGIKGFSNAGYKIPGFSNNSNKDNLGFETRRNINTRPNLIGNQNISETMISTFTDFPSGIKENHKGKYIELYKFNEGDNKGGREYIDRDKLDIIFIVTSSDGRLAQTEIKDLSAQDYMNNNDSMSSLLLAKGITGEEIEIFFKMLKKGADTNIDKKVGDLFVVGNIEQNKSEIGSYFPGETDNFNEKVGNLVNSLGGLPAKAEGFNEEDLKKSPKSQVSEALYLQWTDGNILEQNFKDLFDENIDIIGANKVTIVNSILERLGNIALDGNNEIVKNNIIKKYETLKVKFEIVKKVDEYLTTTGFGVIGTFIGETGFAGWLKENLTNGGKINSLEKISELISKGDELVTELPAGIETEIKEDLIKALIKAIGKLEKEKLSLLSEKMNEESLSDEGKKEYNDKYIKLIKENPYLIQEKVEKITKDFKAVSIYKSDIDYYKMAIVVKGKNIDLKIDTTFYKPLLLGVAITNEKIKLLELIKAKNITSLVPLAVDGLKYFNNYKINLSKFGEEISDKLDKLKEPIKGDTPLKDLKVKQKEFKKLKEIVTNILPEGSNVFSILEEKVKEIDGSFEITKYPNEEDFKLVNEELIKQTQEVMESELKFTDLDNIKLDRGYITKLEKSHNKLESYKELLKDLGDEDSIKSKEETLESKKEKFINELIVEIKNSKLDGLKEHKAIFEIYSKKVGDKFLYVFEGDKYGFKNALEERVKELTVTTVIADIEKESDPKKLEVIYEKYLKENNKIEWLKKYFKDIFILTAGSVREIYEKRMLNLKENENETKIAEYKSQKLSDIPQKERIDLLESYGNLMQQYKNPLENDYINVGLGGTLTFLLSILARYKSEGKDRFKKTGSNTTLNEEEYTNFKKLVKEVILDINNKIKTNI